MKDIKIIIGRGFGDEGKGLAVNYFCRREKKTLVVKHNGGGQAGHTVDLSPDLQSEERFIFHQLSSGSFKGADTFWADSYYPDLYKLDEEIEDFCAAYRAKGQEKCQTINIYASPETCTVLIYDVILNMAIETMRGDDRHGSCGMGINEADLRSRAGFGLTVSEIVEMSAEALTMRLLEIRDTYYPSRLKELGIDDLQKLPAQYRELFEDANVASNAAETMKDNAAFVRVIGEKELFEKYETIVFESGQGLLLDAECEEYAPHVTASRTGLINPVRILKKCDMAPTEIIYVTRSYVTRHGAGPLKNCVDISEIGDVSVDRTNLHNEWQGSIRYALHEELQKMLSPIAKDLQNLQIPGEEAECAPRVSLFVTHLNETNYMLRTVTGDVPAKEILVRAAGAVLSEGKTAKSAGNCLISRLYLSDSPLAEVENVCIVDA